MKSLYLTLLLIGLSFINRCCAQNTVTIPDANFVTWLNNNGFSSCLNGNQLDTTCSAVLTATNMDCSNAAIADLTGIQYFKGLDSLNCTGNNLYNQSTPLQFPGALTYLNCQGCYIPGFPSLPASLQVLLGGGNLLDSLPPLPATLIYLDCDGQFNFPNPFSLTALPAGLKYLFCENLNLQTLPALPGTLVYFNCSSDSLSSLPALPATLTNIYCENNELTGLPSLPSSLIYLDCSYNNITGPFPALPGNLQTLNCENNLITQLPALPNSLAGLTCSGNPLYTLPSSLAGLSSLYCSYDYLSSLPSLPGGLTYLICDHNSLNSLPALPVLLNQLDCSYNNLTSLPDISNVRLEALTIDSNYLNSLPDLYAPLGYLSCVNNNLTTLPNLPFSVSTLICSNNNITILPALPAGLSYLDCSANPDLTCLPMLTNLSFLNFDSTAVTCLPNYATIATCIPPLDSLPLCNILNNNGCSVFWNIAGNVYYDANANCQLDANDVEQANVKVQLYNNGNLVQQVFTEQAGNYSFRVTPGTYTVQPDLSSIPFVTNCPVSGKYTVDIANNTTQSQFNNFAFICPSTGFDIGVQSLQNNFDVPRPGATIVLNAVAGDVSQLYGAFCAAGINGQVQLIFNGALSYVGPANGALTPANISGDTITWNVSDFGTVNNRTAFNVMFKINANATPGSALCFTMNLSPLTGDNNPANNSLQYCTPVVNSLDPNEKEVYPTGNVAPGAWLTYTIRFQNTGTAPAVNILVADTLDADLDPSTFQLIAYSAPTVTQLFGNIVNFNFSGINLPDSLTSDSLSQGFVQYRIQVKDSLNAGTHIQNTASIYFDLNPAVVTNTTSDTISNGPPCMNQYINLSDTICQGTFFVFNNQELENTGFYTDTFPVSGGCDSIVNLNLFVKSIAFNTINETICWDQTYNGHDTTGTYTDTLTGINGCDSITMLTLTVTPAEIAYDTQTICQGQSYMGHDSTGNYIDTITAINSCDKLRYLNLTVTPASNTRTSTSISCGDSVTIGAHVYKLSGTYTDTLTSVSGCDSIIVLQLSVSPDTIYNSGTLCAGDSLNFYGRWIYSPGVYDTLLAGNNTCDTLGILNVIVQDPLPPTYLYDTICANSKVLFNGVYEDTSGTYVAHYSSVNGCDSTVILHLALKPLSQSSTSAAITCGDSVSIGHTFYHLSGTYTDTITGSNGCDSIVTLQLTVTGGDTTYISDTICANSTVFFNGTTINTAGIYTAQYTAGNGCDSTVILHLALKPLSQSSNSATITCGDSVSIGHTFYHLSGTYTDTITGSNGCDSIVTLQLTVTGGDTTYISDTICANSTVFFNGTTINTAGIYTAQYTAVNGCDSTVILHLALKPLSQSSTSASITCGDSVSIGHTFYHLSGTYTDTLTGSNGCDSIVTLQLTVTGGDTTYISDTICANSSLFFNGTTINTAGIYTAQYTAGNGCDSTVILHLALKPLSQSSTSAAITCGDSVSIGHTFYHLSGTYTDTLTGSNGCDSIVTLQLTVTGGDTTYLADTICSNTPLLFDGNYLNSSGTYTAQYNAANGCDSTVILQLAVNPVQITDTTVSMNCGDSVNVAGKFYHLSGTYTDTLPSITGCDSIITLRLSVLGSDTTYASETTCANQPFLFNGVYLDTSGIYVAQYRTATSCDSAVILQLTVLPVYSTDTSVSITCVDSVIIGNNTYKLAGTYTDTLLSVTGCDSFVTLHLTITGKDTTVLYDTICANDSVLYFNGIYINRTGTYPSLYTNVLGCDSLVILNLLVNPLPVVTFTWDSLAAAGIIDTNYIRGYAAWCSYFANTFFLTGGSPGGGTYSGLGVSDNILNADSVWMLLNSPSLNNPGHDTITYSYTDTNGCSSSAQQILLLGVCGGIQTISPDNLFDLYPNPAGDYTMIAINPNMIGATMKLLDVTGAELMTMKLASSTQQLPLSGLAAGVYMVEVETQGDTAVKLLVKTQ